MQSAAAEVSRVQPSPSRGQSSDFQLSTWLVSLAVHSNSGKRLRARIPTWYTVVSKSCT